MLVQAEESGAAVDKGERQTVGLGAGYEDEKQLRRNEIAGFSLLGLERLDGQTALSGGRVERGLGGEIVGQNNVRGFAVLVQTDEAMVAVGADGAGLGQFGVRKVPGVVRGDALGADGHQAHTVAARDLQFFHRLKVDLPVSGLQAQQTGLGKGAGREGYRQERQGFECKRHYGRRFRRPQALRLSIQQARVGPKSGGEGRATRQGTLARFIGNAAGV